MNTEQQEQQPDLQESLIAAFKSAIAAQQPAQPQQQQYQPMTEEQLDQMLGTYRPDMGLVQALFGDNATPESRLQALQHLVHATVQNSTGHARMLGQMSRQQLDQDFAPFIKDAKELGEERFWTELYRGNDNLKQYDAFLRVMQPQMVSQQGWPTNRAESAKKFLEAALPMIKQVNPDFSPASPSPNQQASKPRSTPQGPIPAVTRQTQNLPSFGGGGGQGTATPSGDTSKGVAPWDKMGLGI